MKDVHYHLLITIPSHIDIHSIPPRSHLTHNPLLTIQVRICLHTPAPIHITRTKLSSGGPQIIRSLRLPGLRRRRQHILHLPQEPLFLLSPMVLLDIVVVAGAGARRAVRRVCAVPCEGVWLRRRARVRERAADAVGCYAGAGEGRMSGLWWQIMGFFWLRGRGFFVKGKIEGWKRKRTYSVLGFIVVDLNLFFSLM